MASKESAARMDSSSRSQSMLKLEAGPSVFKQHVDFDHDYDYDNDHHHHHHKDHENSVHYHHGGDEISPWIIFPWTTGYKVWWGVTVLGASLTIFTETYNIAFTSAGLTPYSDGSSIVELILVGIFVLDICINFNLAYYRDEDDDDVDNGSSEDGNDKSNNKNNNDDTMGSSPLVTRHDKIARHYLRSMFWIDLIGVFPFYAIALACSGEMGEDSNLAQWLSLLRLTRLVRLHRLGLVFSILQYSQKISLMSLTLTRNFTAALVWCHFSACVFYFIARMYNFNPDQTWIGGSLADDDLNNFERYLTSLYFAVVTFTTVGYGDYSPVNPEEQIWGILFMLINIIFMSWVIGSITLLIVKADEKTGNYRDSLQRLDKYASMRNLPKHLHKRLKTQLKLEFNTQELNDEAVLSNFPTAMRAKVLRRLYLPSLMQSKLLKGIRQQFLDAFLSLCTVEMISPGEELLQRGSIASDLYFLVSGSVKSVPLSPGASDNADESTNGGVGASTIGGSEYYAGTSTVGKATGRQQDAITIHGGRFINDVSFFTESPQTETVRTRTVCNTLTMSRANYKLVAGDYPDAIGVLLANLLEKAKSMRADGGNDIDDGPKPPSDTAVDEDEDNEIQDAVKSVQRATAIMAVEDLIQAHMHKMKDDHTTQFLFAASRGDTKLVAYMCEHKNYGDFSPDTADYDRRTALMVASMKGHTDTVAKLLEYRANPNLTDMHGSSALYEAASNGHEATVDLLLQHGATLCMDDGQAASRLCQAVFDGDMVLLRRLLQAKINVNACDYDKCTASHIAAAEGNLPALKLLVEHGAAVKEARDRWQNSVLSEAKNSNSSKELVEYLNGLNR